jgi:periplasmic protein TonB
MTMKRKQLFITLLLLMSIGIYGQDTVYFDMKGDKVKSLALADSYRVTIKDSVAANRKIERKYYMSGKIKSEKHLLEIVTNTEMKKPSFQLDGKFREWYGNGQLWKDLNYDQNNLNGEIMTYWDNGQLKRHELFQSGKSVKGECYDREGKSVDFLSFQVLPEFVGGISALMDFLSRNVTYPVAMQKCHLEGKVFVGFIVNKEGSVTDVKVLRGVSPEFDEEAIRVAKSMPKWNPGMQDGEKVNVRYTLPINFKLH